LVVQSLLLLCVNNSTILDCLEAQSFEPVVLEVGGIAPLGRFWGARGR